MDLRQMRARQACSKAASGCWRRVASECRPLLCGRATCPEERSQVTDTATMSTLDSTYIHQLCALTYTYHYFSSTTSYAVLIYNVKWLLEANCPIVILSIIYLYIHTYIHTDIFMMTTDLFPTLLEACCIPAPAHLRIDGYFPPLLPPRLI